MDNIFSFVLLSVMILLLLDIRHTSKPMSEEEKVAYATRLLKNLLPIAPLFITDAENQFGPGTGSVKRAYVINELYKSVPDEYKKLITEENLDLIIATVLPKIEGVWAENPQIMNH
ncbi:MAG: hypothetical protein PHX43_05355 [Alphaproteobacteria bacterium]|nr:hypothetical protein [Alphaproteobacteria bacterium]